MLEVKLPNIPIGTFEKALTTASSWKTVRQPGQILVMTVLLLLVISLTVIGVTAVAARNASQVGGNVDYAKSYNTAEGTLLSVIDELSSPELNLSSLAGSKLGDLDCVAASGAGSEIVCGTTDPDGRRSVITASEQSTVSNYNLGIDEYFDIILSQGTNSYRDSISLSWLGKASFEVDLIYEEVSGKLATAKQIVDIADNYEAGGAAGIFSPAPRIEGDNSITIDLRDITVSKVPATAKYKFLRIRTVSKDSATSISIRPLSTTGLFPNQIRQIEAFSYDSSSSTGSTPVIQSQLPLSPQVIPALRYGLNLASVQQPICGDGVVQGIEECDPPGAGCPRTCYCREQFNSGFFETQGGEGCALPAGRFIVNGDSAVQYSAEEITICTDSSNDLTWSNDSILDDTLVLIPANTTIRVEPNPMSGGFFYYLPPQHLIIAPNAGELNGGAKTFRVDGSFATYEFATGNEGSIQGFKDAGFNIATFEETLSINLLQSLGFVVDGVASFKFAHIGSGCGFASVRLQR